MIIHSYILLVLVLCTLRKSVATAETKKTQDPDVGLNMVEIVQKRGYEIETHYVTTQDGYVLTVFRIPGPENSAPVILQHGLLDSSYTWVSNFENESLGYMLANEGFDVWFGNNRGNAYGRNHTTLNPDDPYPNAFWEFTYDEMGRYDAPAMIEYILAETKKDSMSWVGHSEGTMQIFAGGSLDIPTYSKLNLFVGLAPVASVANIKSPELIRLAQTNLAQHLIEAGLMEFFPLNTNPGGNKMDSHVCQLLPRICNVGIDTLCGPSIHINATRLQVYTSETPAGTSTVNMNHFIQGIIDTEGLFRMYDWGTPDLNAAHYDGATTPPIYDLTQFNVPTALFSGGWDWMADPIDVQKLYDQIPAEYIVHSQKEKTFSHLDYVWAPAAAEKVYKPAIKLLKQYAQK